MNFFRERTRFIRILNLAILLILSTLVLYIRYVNSIDPTQRAIEVVWTNDDALKSIPSIERYEGRLTKTENRKYKSFYLVDGDKHDLEKLRLIKKETEQFLLLKDTTVGIHIHFGPSTRLWTLVRVHDIINGTEGSDYIQHGDDIWIFYKPKLDLPHL